MANGISVSRGLRYYSSAKSQTVKLAFTLHTPPLQSRKLRQSEYSGPPIVFMHGLLGSRKNNRSMSRALASDLNRPIYAVDLRNHGDSDHHDEHNYVALAADIEAFIHEHDLKRPTLIGHSMGAKTALTLALQSPNLINRVVAIDNAPINLPLQQDFYDYIKAMKTIEEANVTSLKQADQILLNFERSPEIRLFLLTNLKSSSSSPNLRFRVPISTLASALGNLGDFPFDDSANVSFNKPVLIVRATRSHYIPDTALPLIKKFFPISTVVNIDCGHWVIAEKPEEFRSAAVQFLKDE